MTKKIVYFKDLSDEAKEKARDWWRSIDNMPMLESHLTNVLKERLEENGFKVIGKYDKNGNLTGSKDLRIFYSLSNSQGDGVSFEGTLSRNGIMYHVKQSGYYVHEFTLDITAENSDYEEVEISECTMEKIRKACRETEAEGYSTIEYESSPEYIDELLEVNEYTFSIDGERLNPDKNK